jgi:uncharacterized membrane protein
VKLKLSRNQFQYYSSAVKTLSEGIMLGSLAAYFLPQAFQMNESISFIKFLSFFSVGPAMLILGGIMTKKGKRND